MEHTKVERDLQVLGVRRRRDLVADRKKWKDVVRQAEAHSGLYCQWKKKKGKIQERREEEVERDLQVLGVRRRRDLVGDIKK